MTKKIMIICDVVGWAIDSLSQAIVRHNPHFEFSCFYLHPRDVGQRMEDFKKAVGEFKPDVIHFQYYRSCSQALELWPELKNYKIILTHHNQRTKAVRHKRWQQIGVDQLVCHTQKCRKMLLENGERDVRVIQHGIDLGYFSYSDKEPKEPRIGYVGRIVPWKGLLEICRAARELNFKVLVMGKIDKPDYWQKVEEYKDVLDMSFYDCKDEERIGAYRGMTAYVGNSLDYYEEGTLPYLEAMVCGVPVVTTLSGEAGDLARDGENALVVPFGDYNGLKAAIGRVMADKGLRQRLRANAWTTVKTMDERKMARQYSSLYYGVGDGRPLVSVVIPATFDRFDEVHKILKALEKQTYGNIEAVVVWDEDSNACISVSPEDLEERKYKEMENYSFPVKELRTNRYGYNLAMARNMGIVEAEGEYIMFNDARLCPEPDAVERFIDAARTPSDSDTWLFGDKGGGKKSFVENFSFVERKAVVKFGMFSERIDAYGGMSQEVRTRWKMQGNQFLFVGDAKASQIAGSHLTGERRRAIVEMKLKLFKMFGGIDF